jgi:hypothetical protein
MIHTMNLKSLSRIAEQSSYNKINISVTDATNAFHTLINVSDKINEDDIPLSFADILLVFEMLAFEEPKTEPC